MDTRLEYLCPTHHSSPHTPGGKEEGRKEEGRRDGVSSSLSQAGPSCRLMFVYNPSAQLGKFSVHCPPLGSINKVKLKAVRLFPSHPHTSLSTFHNLHNHTSHMHLRVHTCTYADLLESERDSSRAAGSWNQLGTASHSPHSPNEREARPVCTQMR